HGLLQFTRADDFRALRKHRHDPGLLQRRQIDHTGLHPGQLVQAHLRPRGLEGGTKADLRQAALQRHLPALESDLVIAALARSLALDAPAAGLALAGGGAATDAPTWPAGTGTRLDVVQTHQCCSTLSGLNRSVFNRCRAAWIMPRFSGVSATETV